MEYVAPLGEVDETLKCVCLQQTVSGSGEEGGVLGRVKERRELVAPDEWLAVAPL